MWLESGNAARAETARRGVRAVQSHWQDDIRIGVEEREGRWQHANDFVRPGVDDHRVTDDVLAAERALPPAVRQDDAERRAWKVVLSANQPAEFGLNSQQRERAIRDPQRRHFLRRAVSENGDLLGLPQADLLNDSPMVAIREIRGLALRHFPAGAKSGREVVESHEPVRLGEGQRLQEHAIDHAEHRRRRADSQCEREDRHRSEPAILGQDSARKSDVCP